MKIRKSTLQRVAIVSLASWFAVLTGFVQGPHLHPANELTIKTDLLCSIFNSHDVRSNIGVPVEQINAGGGLLWEAQNNLGHCFACLFLKNCKERAISQDSFIPVLTPIKHAMPQRGLAPAFFVIVSSCPRAPPVQTT